MTDPIDKFPPLPSNSDPSNIDSATASNIPISDFRRNEARPILTDDGRIFFDEKKNGFVQRDFCV